MDWFNIGRYIKYIHGSLGKPTDKATIQKYNNEL